MRIVFGLAGVMGPVQFLQTDDLCTAPGSLFYPRDSFFEVAPRLAFACHLNQADTDLTCVHGDLDSNRRDSMLPGRFAIAAIQRISGITSSAKSRKTLR
jgi:hypothetical protein